MSGLESRLSGADFSRESRVRAGLKARLLARRPRRLPALAAAAAVLALLAPAAWRELRPAPATLYPRGELGLPVLPGRLPGESAAAEAVVRSVPGRVEVSDGRRRVIWSLDGGTYVLETRRTSIEELFVRR